VSDRESLPESHPLAQLSQLVHNLGDELAVFRKRALQAEATLRGYESAKSSRSGDLFAEQRVGELEKRPVTGSQAAVGNGLEPTRAAKSSTRGRGGGSR
jgi:hypothetical protein